jgi:hypothetical protein
MTIFEEIKADIEKAVQEQLITPALVDRGKGWIDQLERESPLVYKLLMAVLYREPATALRALAVWEPDFKELVNNPVAVKYVRLLQERLRTGA